MANSLKRDLKPGDKVVLKGGAIAVCFGSCAYTMGTALDVSIEGILCLVNGYEINAQETMEKFANENGWNQDEAANV